jgi:hypothetical protein
MTTKNVKEFLERFSAEKLKKRGILRGASNMLQGVSVEPFIELMKDSGIQKLEFPPIGWSLDTEHNFSNPFSPELKKGRVQELSKQGSVFTSTNVRINPHYQGASLDPDTEEAIEEAGQITFGLEKDLQKNIRQSIEQLEPGLRISDGGNERSVEGGRIDITAEDNEGKMVAIELKAGTAKSDSIAQILAYMSYLSEEEHKPVRGIIVAGDFDKRTLLAARAVPNLQLKQYSVSFSFKDL